MAKVDATSPIPHQASSSPSARSYAPHPPQLVAPIRMPVEESPEQDHLCGNYSRNLLLGIDDSGSIAHVRALMDWLEGHNAGAIFFVVKSWVDASPQNRALVDEMRRRGFWVGNHSVTHPSGGVIARSVDMEYQIDAGETSNYFRPPEGATNAHLRSELVKRQIHQCLWNNDPTDWEGWAAPVLASRILSQIDQGHYSAVVHMLDHSNLLGALQILEAQVAQGKISFCPLSSEPTTPIIPYPLPC